MIIFGGTFDPIHNGHLAIANAVYTLFKEPIIFMPTRSPSYKTIPLTTNEERLTMLELAVSNNHNYKINTLEIKQPAYSCSYKTLTYLRNQIGDTLPLYYIIGGDSLVDLDTWDNWLNLFALTNFIVINRPNYFYLKMHNQLKSIFNARKTTNFANLDAPYGKIYLLDSTLSDISSTSIRNKIKNGQAIDDYVPPTVAKYILQHNLYKD